MTKINYEFIQKIFNRKIELKKNEDKIKLSKYSEYIPMYDIYSDNIYPIQNINIHYRLVDCHYRFITSEVKQWIFNKMEKTDDKGLKLNYQKSIDIINNYNLEVLEKTSYETLYKYSPKFGLSISICKRNSFHPFAKHLTPYYTKNELIKLGMNNNIIDKLTPESLIDKELHYKICKLVSKNDVSANLILKHMQHIIDNDCINWIVFYSFMGSYIFNEYLRNKDIKISNYLLDGLKKVIKVMDNVDGFEDDYYFYRFVWDDKFIKNLEVGDHFTDKGFLSTTRDPFYSPGMNMDFGLILLKINIPKNIKGVGLFVENFSMFPKEEEFLLKPGSKFKLVGKNNNFEYKHINKKFERNIKKKYEFTLVSSKNDISKYKSIDSNKIPELKLSEINLKGKDRIDLFKQFLKNCDEMDQFKFKGKIFTCEFFDGSSSYSHLFYNNNEEGLILNHYVNGYPLLSIECGDELVVNYAHTLNYYDKNISDKIEYDNEVISLISLLFGYEKANIYFPYRNFERFSKNYEENKSFLHNNMFCYPIYLYFKENKKYVSDKYYNFNYGFFKLDEIMKKKIPNEIHNKIPNDINKDITWKELYILIVEKYFYLYKNLEGWMNYHFKNLFKKCYYEFDTLTFLKNNNYDISYFPSIKHSKTRIDSKRFDMIFNDVFRREN